MARPRKLTPQEAEWPKIRPRFKPDGVTIKSYMVDSVVPVGDGGRIQQCVKTLDAAKTLAASIRNQYANAGLNGFALSEGERDDARRALEALKAAGLQTTLSEAASHFILHNKPPAGDITLGKLREKYLERCSQAGLRDITVSRYATRLRAFVDVLGENKLVKSITPDEVEAFLDRSNTTGTRRTGLQQTSAQTRLNDYTVLHSLFEFAVKPRHYQGRKTKQGAPLTGWIAKNPVADFIKPVVGEREPTVLDAQTAADLLRAAYETRDLPPSRKEIPDQSRQSGRWASGKNSDKVGMLPEIVLGLFGGLRPSEITRLNWSDIELHLARVTIRKSKNRAGQRQVQLPPAAVAWLKECPKQKGPVHHPRNARRRFDRLKEKAGINEWSEDILRHTAASVFYRLNNDAGKARAHLGQSSTGVLFQNYLALMSEEEALRIHNLTPSIVLQKKIDNIVPLVLPKKSRADAKLKHAPAKSSRPKKLIAASAK